MNDKNESRNVKTEIDKKKVTYIHQSKKKVNERNVRMQNRKEHRKNVVSILLKERKKQSSPYTQNCQPYIITAKLHWHLCPAMSACIILSHSSHELKNPSKHALSSS